MPEESAGDRTEDATPRRQQRERERGRVAKSRDLSAAGVLLGGVLLLRYGGFNTYKWLARSLTRLIREDMGSLPPPRGGMEILPHVYTWLQLTAYAAGPFLLALFGIALFVNLAQVGFLFSTDPLAPDLNRINPVSGLKRMFGLRALMTLLMNLAKLALVVVVAYVTLQEAIPKAAMLEFLPPTQIFIHSGFAIYEMALRLAIVFFLVGVADMAYQYYQYHKDMRMTKQEVKEEMKEMEGDPHIRARRRQIQRQMAMQRMMQEVPGAEVVVRNPTHYAVALKYEESMNAPAVVAKGTDLVALRIVEIAEKNDVPCYRNVQLARQLYKVDLGESIPPALFPAVAEVMAYVYRRKGRGVESARPATAGAR